LKANNVEKVKKEGKITPPHLSGIDVNAGGVKTNYKKNYFTWL
jgi:hypothetical protein